MRLFLKNRQGHLVQVFICLLIMGTLSFAFWNNWKTNVIQAGTELKNNLESENWLDQ